VPPSNIDPDLDFLLASDVEVDVSFIVKGETIEAHRAILAARSPVFRAELFGTMSDATSPSIELQDIEPEVFKSMLFMDANELPEDEELSEDDEDGDSITAMTQHLTAMAQHLLAAADRYAMDRLKLM
jgi:speckle-type POZ protein